MLNRRTPNLRQEWTPAEEPLHIDLPLPSTSEMAQRDLLVGNNIHSSGYDPEVTESIIYHGQASAEKALTCLRFINQDKWLCSDTTHDLVYALKLAIPGKLTEMEEDMSLLQKACHEMEGLGFYDRRCLCIKSRYPDKLDVELSKTIPAFCFTSNDAEVALTNASAIWQIVAKTVIKFCGEVVGNTDSRVW